jgi:hypothetical protein
MKHDNLPDSPLAFRPPLFTNTTYTGFNCMAQWFISTTTCPLRCVSSPTRLQLSTPLPVCSLLITQSPICVCLFTPTVILCGLASNLEVFTRQRGFHCQPLCHILIEWHSPSYTLPLTSPLNFDCLSVVLPRQCGFTPQFIRLFVLCCTPQPAEACVSSPMRLPLSAPPNLSLQSRRSFNLCQPQFLSSSSSVIL